MSDFLTNLVVRSSRGAGDIRPRIPSLFEPRLPHFLSSVVPGSDSPAKSRAEEISPTQPKPERRASAIEDAPTERETDTKPAVRRAPPEVPAPRRSSLPSVDEKQPGDAPSQPHLAFEISELQPAPTGSKLTRESLSPARSEKRPNDDSFQDVASRVPTAGLERSPSVARFLEPPVTSAKPWIPPAEEIARLVKSFIKPRTDLRAGEARSGAADFRSNQSEPVIQVTIGRVEVRATPHQAHAAKERSGPAVMSLDDYLRGRQKRAGA